MSVYFNAPNKYPAPCPGCRKMVPKLVGVNFFYDAMRKPWVWHKECLSKKREEEDTRAEKGARIDIDLDEEGRVVVRNSSTGSKTRFNSILASLGFRWVSEAGRHFGSFGAAPMLINTLKDNYEVYLGDRINKKIDENRLRAREDQEVASQRANRIDAILSKRNLHIYDYQRKTIAWLAPRMTGLVGHSPGLGKTLCALAALPPGAPVVIACPKNAVGVWLKEFCLWRPDYGSCRHVYKKSLLYLEPEKGIEILEGINSFKWPNPGEVVIVGYSILPVTPAEHEDATALVGEWEKLGQPDEFKWTPIGAQEPEEVELKDIKAAQRVIPRTPIEPPPAGTVMIADEAHNVKVRKGKRQSNRARRFAAAAEYVRNSGGRTWTLTGTPLLNEPTELWAVLSATGNAEEIFGTKDLFLNHYKKNGKDWDVSPHVTKMLGRGMLRYNKRDVLKELPPKTRVHVDVDISPEAKETLDALLVHVEEVGGDHFLSLFEKEREKILKAEEKRKEREAKKKKRKKKKEEEEEDDDDEEDEKELTEAELLIKAQEAAAEAAQDGYIAFEDLSRVRATVAKAKIPALLRVVDEHVKRGEKVVVFSSFREPVRAVYENYGGEKGGWMFINGDVPSAKRSAIEESFQRERKDGGMLVGIAATIEAAGVALTLTKAHIVIFCDEDWVPAKNLQAQDRCHRIGQFKDVTIKVLVAKHPIDEMIASANESKIKLTEDTIDAAAMDPEADMVTIADEFDDLKKEIIHIGERQEEQTIEELEEAHELEVATAYEREHPTSVPGTFVAPPRGGTVQLPGSPGFAGGSKPEREPGDDQDEPLDLIPKPFELPAVRDPKRSAPKTPDQIAAAKVLLQALEFGGFRQGDTFTPSIASQLKSSGGLTEKQWPYAIKGARELGANVTVTKGATGGPRGPSGPMERWAAHGLQMLADADTDFAREQNGVGFSRDTGEAGHDFANKIAAGAGLTEGQWAYAIKIATRHRRQIGSPPNVGVEENPVAAWYVIITEGIRGDKDTGVLGNDDIQVQMVVTRDGPVPEKLVFPKLWYTPEEAALWAEAYGMPWIRVEG